MKREGLLEQYYDLRAERNPNPGRYVSEGGCGPCEVMAVECCDGCVNEPAGLTDWHVGKPAFCDKCPQVTICPEAYRDDNRCAAWEDHTEEQDRRRAALRGVL